MPTDQLGFAKRRHGREHKAGDERSVYQRDRDRLLYCNAFRRLAGVTQVISPIEGDVVHNRLTHSLKVAQIARRLAEKLRSQSDNATDDRPDPDLVEAAALAHDLGHPPFGHAGEEMLNRFLREAAITQGASDTAAAEGYEGNAQSFRIVTRLALRSSDYRGLDLARGTLNGLLKYPWLHEPGEPIRSRKWGAYQSEATEYRWTTDFKGFANKQSLEAAIMDWSDDVTYAVHDVQDFYKAGLIPLHSLANDPEERHRFLEQTFEKWQKRETIDNDAIARYRTAFTEIIEIVPFQSAYTGEARQLSDLVSLGSQLITRYTNDLAIDIGDDGQPGLTIPQQLRDEIRIMKELNRHYVISSAPLMIQQHGLKQVIRELLEIYSSNEADKLIPAWIAAELEPNCSPLRRAADIVAALTDAQALRIHQSLTGRTPGSIRDWF